MNARLALSIFCFLFFPIAKSHGSACTDSVYLKLSQIQLQNISKDEFETYLKLDSLCKMEAAGATIIRTKSFESKKYSEEPFESDKFGNKQHKIRKGRGWFWTSLVLGSLYFAGSSVAMASISDNCSYIFITDIFKSEEECKEEADAARNVAGVGMVFGGILSAIGIYGLAATSPGP